MAFRPLHKCDDCGYTWHSRGGNYSLRCPNCGSGDHHRPFNLLDSIIGLFGLGVMGIFGLLVLSLFVGGGESDTPPTPTYSTPVPAPSITPQRPEDVAPIVPPASTGSGMINVRPLFPDVEEPVVRGGSYKF